MKIRRESSEYVWVQVQPREDIDPTFDTVALAFVVPGNAAQPTDWVTGAWQKDLSGPTPQYFAYAMAGPYGSVGKWDVLVKVTDDPEVPVLRSGTLEII